MAEVYLDGERVQFEGPVPANPGELLVLLNHVLEKQERCITRYFVNGINYLQVAEEHRPLRFDRVEAVSQRQSKVLLDMIGDAMRNSAKLEGEMEEFSNAILRRPWSEMVREMQEFAQKLNPLVELLVLLEQYGESRNEIWEEQVQALHCDFTGRFLEILNAAENRDIAHLSDLIANRLIPLLRRALNVISGTVCKVLEAKHSNP